MIKSLKADVVLTADDKESQHKELHHVCVSTVCSQKSGVFIPYVVLLNTHTLKKMVVFFSPCDKSSAAGGAKLAKQEP